LVSIHERKAIAYGCVQSRPQDCQRNLRRGRVLLLSAPLAQVGLPPARCAVLAQRVRLFVAATMTDNVVEAVVALTAGTLATSTALIVSGRRQVTNGVTKVGPYDGHLAKRRSLRPRRPSRRGLPPPDGSLVRSAIDRATVRCGHVISAPAAA
jgi:hypothetical protein